MPSPTVTQGLYSFFTKADLDQERLRYKEEVKKSNSQLTSASINGQSFQFTVQGRELTLPQWADELKFAYSQLGIDDHGLPTPTRSRLRFS